MKLIIFAALLLVVLAQNSNSAVLPFVYDSQTTTGDVVRLVGRIQNVGVSVLLGPGNNVFMSGAGVSGLQVGRDSFSCDAFINGRPITNGAQGATAIQTATKVQLTGPKISFMNNANTSVCDLFIKKL